MQKSGPSEPRAPLPRQPSPGSSRPKPDGAVSIVAGKSRGATSGEVEGSCSGGGLFKPRLTRSSMSVRRAASLSPPHALHGQQNLLAVATNAKHNQQRDRRG